LLFTFIVTLSTPDVFTFSLLFFFYYSHSTIAKLTEAASKLSDTEERIHLLRKNMKVSRSHEHQSPPPFFSVSTIIQTKNYYDHAQSLKSISRWYDSSGTVISTAMAERKYRWSTEQYEIS